MEKMEQECYRPQRLTFSEIADALISLAELKKRDIAVATLMGAVLLLIQFIRAGTMPEFDWSAGANVVILVAVLALSLVMMGLLVLLLAVPSLVSGLAQQAIDRSGTAQYTRIRERYLSAIALYVIVLAAVDIASSVLPTWWPALNGIKQGWVTALVFVALLFPAVLLSAMVVPPPEGVSWWRRIFLRGKNYGRVALALIYVIIIYALISSLFPGLRAGGNEGRWALYALVAVLLLVVNGMLLYLPRWLPAYALAGGVVFVILCIPASNVAFSQLGLGNRKIEFVLKDAQQDFELRRAGLEPNMESGVAVYHAWLRLRIGSNIVVSRDASNWGHYANAVPIPKAALAGLWLVPEMSSVNGSGARDAKTAAKQPAP